MRAGAPYPARVAALLALLSSVLWGSADFLGGVVSRRRAAALVVGASQLAGLLVDRGGGRWWPARRRPDRVPALGGGCRAVRPGRPGLLLRRAGVRDDGRGLADRRAGGHGPRVRRPGSWRAAGRRAARGHRLAIGGVVLASGPELRGRAGARPLLLAVVAAVGFGLALLFIAEGSRTSTLMTLVGMRMTSVSVLAVALLVALGRVGRERLVLDRRDAALVAVVGVGDVAANLAFGLASTRGLVSVVAVLGSLYPVVTVLLARIVLHERLGWRRRWGSPERSAGSLSSPPADRARRHDTILR